MKQPNNFVKKWQKISIKIGIWLDVSGLLGASSDGHVEDEAVLQVKYPYSIYDKTIKNLLTKLLFFVMLDDDKQLQLKKDHIN